MKRTDWIHGWIKFSKQGIFVIVVKAFLLLNHAFHTITVILTVVSKKLFFWVVTMPIHSPNGSSIWVDFHVLYSDYWTNAHGIDPLESPVISWQVELGIPKKIHYLADEKLNSPPLVRFLFTVLLGFDARLWSTRSQGKLVSSKAERKWYYREHRCKVCVYGHDRKVYDLEEKSFLVAHLSFSSLWFPLLSIFL